MNALNRLILLLIALLLVAVPVLLLVIAFGYLSADLVDSYTGYRAGLQALGDFSVSNLGRGPRTIAGIAGALVSLIALLLLLRELTLGHRVARNAVIDDTPGKETKVTSGAVRSLAEAAALEVGAESPSASLRSRGRRYRVLCDVQAPASSNCTQLAARSRENIQRALASQNVPVKDVEVTVQRTAL